REHQPSTPGIPIWLSHRPPVRRRVELAPTAFILSSTASVTFAFVPPIQSTPRLSRSIFVAKTAVNRFAPALYTRRKTSRRTVGRIHTPHGGCVGGTLVSGRLEMADRNRPHGVVRPRTAVLTLGFDPTLSVGSARPAVFRSSTYVFPSPEEAEHAFDITTGKIQPADGGRADLIYSRFSHPNAEILEDQIVPLDAGGAYAAVFNSGMAAIMTACFAFARPDSTMVYTTPLYGGTTEIGRAHV